MAQSAYEIESFGLYWVNLLIGIRFDGWNHNRDNHLNRKWKSNCYTKIIMTIQWIMAGYSQSIINCLGQIKRKKSTMRRRWRWSPTNNNKKKTHSHTINIVYGFVKIQKEHTNCESNAYTHEFSFSVASKNPLIFQMNMAPSPEPAAIWLISRLNDTRDQSQPTLKLSLLQSGPSGGGRRTKLTIKCRWVEKYRLDEILQCIMKLTWTFW